MIATIFIRDYYLQYTNFMSLINKDLVIMSPVISVYAFRDKNSISPHMTPLFIDPLTEPKLANFLR